MTAMGLLTIAGLDKGKQRARIRTESIVKTAKSVLSQRLVALAWRAREADIEKIKRPLAGFIEYHAFQGSRARVFEVQEDRRLDVAFEEDVLYYLP